MTTASQADLRRAARVRHVIYLLVAAAIVVPHLVRVSLPAFKPSDQVKKVYDKIESFPRGTHVLVSMDFDPASKAELAPMTVAILRHCFKKGLIPVMVTHWPNGLEMCRSLCEDVAKESGKVRGRDWAFLGFKPGGYVVLLGMCENVKETYAKDYYGQPAADMPALAGVKAIKDFGLIVDIAAGSSVEMWIAFAADRQKVPFAAGVTAVAAPGMYTYIGSGQMLGLLGGLRGAADYETLVKLPAAASAGMNAQSVGHLLLIALLVGANLWFFVSRLRGRRHG